MSYPLGTLVFKQSSCTRYWRCWKVVRLNNYFSFIKLIGLSDNLQTSKGRILQVKPEWFLSNLILGVLKPCD